MKKRSVVLLILATVLTVAGLCLATLAFVAASPDLSRLGSVGTETKEQVVNEEFSSILVDVDTADVRLEPAADGICRVVSTHKEGNMYLIGVRNGKLEIRYVKQRGFTLFYFGKSEITVYLPHDAYESISVETDTGDVKIPADFSFVDVSLEADTGDISVSAAVTGKFSVSTNTGDIKASGQKPQSARFETDTGSIALSALEIAENLKVSLDTDHLLIVNTTVGGVLEIESDTGDVALRDVLAAAFEIESDTGDVELVRCDAERIRIETDTGDVECLLLSGKIFQVRSRTGKEEVPMSSLGGECVILSSTGDIEVEIAS